MIFLGKGNNNCGRGYEETFRAESFLAVVPNNRSSVLVEEGCEKAGQNLPFWCRSVDLFGVDDSLRTFAVIITVLWDGNYNFDFLSDPCGSNRDNGDGNFFDYSAHILVLSIICQSQSVHMDISLWDVILPLYCGDFLDSDCEIVLSFHFLGIK